MGLLNVYSFNKTIKPHLAYRFKVTFYYNKSGEEIKSLTYFVKSVELPVWNISTETRQRFGNTQYVIPTFDFGQSTLKIVFMETDQMSITYFLNGFLFHCVDNRVGTANLWNNLEPEILKIQIDELDPSMRGTIVTNIYACNLKKLTVPKLSNTAYGTPTEIEAEFVVRYKLNNINVPIIESDRLPIEQPETLEDDLLTFAKQQNELKKIIDAHSKNALESYQAYLTMQQRKAYFDAQRKKLSAAQNRAKNLRTIKMQNAKKAVDKDGKIYKNGTYYFISGEAQLAYLEKKQKEAIALNEKLQKKASLLYEDLEINISKDNWLKDLEGRYKAGEFTDEDLKEVEAFIKEAQKLDALKKDIWKIENKSGLIEMSEDEQFIKDFIGLSKADYTTVMRDIANDAGSARTELAKEDALYDAFSNIDKIKHSNMSNREKVEYIYAELKKIDKLDKSISDNMFATLGVNGDKEKIGFDKLDKMSVQDRANFVQESIKALAGNGRLTTNNSGAGTGTARSSAPVGATENGDGSYRGKKGSVDFNAQTTTYADGTTMSVLDITGTSMRNKSDYRAFHESNEGETRERDVTVVLHRQAGSGTGYTKNLGSAAHDSISTGAAIYIDDNGNVVVNMDRVRELGSTAAQGKDTRGAIAIEISGAVDIRKGSDGKYYARTVTGRKYGDKDVIYKEISEDEAKKYGLYEYDESNSNAQLMSSVDKAKVGSRKAVDAAGNLVNVTFTNVYAQGYSQAQLDALRKVGDLLRSQGINVTNAVSHGMIDTSSAKTEGNDITNQQGMNALGFG